MKSATSIENFNNLLNVDRLADLGYEGKKITWNNRLFGGCFIRERIDRCLVSDEWRLNFPNVGTICKVGITDEKNSDLERLAIDIAKKCHGLPMSIVTTAKALKNQSRYVWQETLNTLERQKLAGTPEYSTKLSYELLANEELKLIFLLCACMDQDALVSDLVRLCIGLGFLEGVYTAKEARDQVQMLLIHLKESGLLSDSYSNDRFTMQNLVRKAALLIASENNVFVLAKRKLDEWPDDDKLERYTSVFLHHCDVNTEEFPKSLKCPNLKVFHFHNNSQHFEIPNDFFREMKELRVLVLLGIDLSKMSSSMKCLRKLRKLCLEQCINLDEELCNSIGTFMKNLRILSFSGSDIKSLPTKLKGLSKLQILDLSNCSQLKSIQAGVISSLTSLEELYMRNTLVEWRMDNREETENKNASLSELGHLTQITNVDFQIPSVAHLPENLFFDKLHSYKIVIGSSSTFLEPDFKIPEKYQLLRYLAILEKDVGIHSQKGIKMLFERVENLLLEELNGVQDIFYALNLKGFPCLKTLSIVSTLSIRYLINPQERKHPENAFPKLETLHLYKLDNMEQLCSRVSLSSSSFCKLKVVKIKLCGLLKNVFVMSMVKLLVALQTIEILECNSLKEIVFVEDTQDSNTSKPLKFQELRTLTLKSLPEFHGFCSISSTAQQKVLFDEQVEFSKLERLQLSSIQIHQIWNGKNPPFGKLVHLEVNGCGNLKSLLTLSMAINMKTLQSLSVSECDKMGQILLNENSNDIESEKKVHRTLVDQGSSADILFKPVFDKLGLDEKELRAYPDTLYGLGDTPIKPLGFIPLHTTFGKGEKSKTLSIDFTVVDVGKASDMPGIDPELMSHKLLVYPGSRPIQQRKRKLGPE
nr:disease resistance protein RPS2-like [Arachis hypogaea]